MAIALADMRPDLEIACILDPRRDRPIMLDRLSSRVRIVEDVTAIANDAQRITHYLQAGLFEGRKPVEVLFPPELEAHRPRLGAIVYDLIPWLFPREYLGDDGLMRHYFRVLASVQRLDRLFAISESVRRDVIAIGNAASDRVVTIHGGVDDERWAAANAPELRGQRYPVHISNGAGDDFVFSGPFWLYVGGDDFRKNIPRLLEAFGLVLRAGHVDTPLVLACAMEPARIHELETMASSAGLRPGADVVFTGYVSDETLGRLFANCLATVFPSLYEGLGLPVLESYWFGRPALASDSSALKELVPPSCRFDPTSAASIAQAMLRFRDDPGIGQESLDYADRALKTYRWTSAARAVADWVDEPLAPRNRPKPRALLVAGSLPPATSGVAFYTQQSLAAPAHPVTFFAPARTAGEIEAARTSIAEARHGLQREASPVQVLRTGALHDVRQALPSDPVLFVLGNSEHHRDTVAHLLAYGARPTDVVHLHDIYLGRLLTEHFETMPALEAALLAAYDRQRVTTWFEGGRRLVDGGVLGPRLLVVAAGVRKFLVNSRAAKDRLEADLGEWRSRVSVDVAFLPILHADLPAVTHDPAVLRIGHFGIVGRHKQPDRLVEACDLLASRQAIQVLFAGYGVREAIQVFELDRPYVVVADSPSDEELQRLMGTVDCAVQLRYPDYGESSGVINQLLALRRPVVCTRTGSSSELDAAVTLVPPDVEPGELASAIARATSLGWSTAAERLLSERTPQVFEERIREILGIAATA